MSILSQREDGMGYFYGFRPGDYRQINVRYEMVDDKPVADIPTPGWGGAKFGGWWVAYVGGKPIGCYENKSAAERMALQWMDENP